VMLCVRECTVTGRVFLDTGSETAKLRGTYRISHIREVAKSQPERR